MLECCECRKAILHPHYLDGKVYGHNCYQKAVALKYKHFQDSRNDVYSAKCFAAMQVFEPKRPNKFHDSICEQWNDCKKLTAKQLKVILDSFTDEEQFEYYRVLYDILSENYTDESESAKWWCIRYFSQFVSKYNYDVRDHFDEFAKILDIIYPQGYFLTANGDITPNGTPVFLAYRNEKGRMRKIKDDNGYYTVVGCKNEWLEDYRQDLEDGFENDGIIYVKKFAGEFVKVSEKWKLNQRSI